MAKQIKIGFDKVPSPVTKQFPQLKDIFGADLLDAAGNPLRTEEDAVLGVFTEAQQSLSVHVNNHPSPDPHFRVKSEYTDRFEGGVTGLTISNAGTGYGTINGAYVTTTTNGLGSGLLVDYTVDNDGINGISVHYASPSPGSGYKVGDVITVTTGDANATATVTSVVGEGQSVSATVPGTFKATNGSGTLTWVTDLGAENPNDGTDNDWASGYTLADALDGVKYIYIPNDYNLFSVYDAEVGGTLVSAGKPEGEYNRQGSFYEVTGLDTATNTVSITPDFNGDTRVGYTLLKAEKIFPKSETIPIEEQFPGESEVSSTLLGVPRAEEQLSLFSDVAVYGLDEDNWNYYTFNPANVPSEWYRKENPVFGRRTAPRFEEASEEQGLYLYSYPSQYNFPSGPRNTQGTVSSSFREYMSFIAFGKFLYRLYINELPLFAEQNFLDDNIKIMNSTITDTVENREITIDTNSYNTDTDPAQINNVTGETAIAYDVDYGDNPQDSFDQIERFTAFWQKVKDGRTDIFPNSATALAVAGNPTTVASSSLVQTFRNFVQQNTQAGGGSRSERFGILESQKTFRYQPGRVSGFTYGVRLKSDLRSEDNIIEFGVSNDTDEYMIQVRGTKLNIVRRSVISLFESPSNQVQFNHSQALRMGYKDVEEALEAEKLVFPVRLKNDEIVQPERNGQTGTHYELVIDRENWNGDKLDGTGNSGYTLTYEEVTMYKIEFSWYGAIGAKFYAYVPSGNGEARWVLMHTLIIENGLGQPCLRNPDFKFKYFIYSPNTEQLEQPLYLYKYGSSYYIDGGDEGTIRLTSVSGDSKEFTQRTPIIGIMPKERIFNGDGIELTNFKKTYPSQISVTTDSDVRIDIEEVQGSPEGHHFYYAPGLQTDETSSTTADLRFNTAGTSVEFVDDTQAWTAADDGAHLIADGIYGCYVGFNQSNASGADAFIADLKRKSGFGEPQLGSEIEPFTLKSDGTVFEPRSGATFNARITNFNDVAASTIPINSTKFKIHFLNPRPLESGGRHSADFLVGVTQKEPQIDNNDNRLKFSDGVTLEEINFDENPHVIWSNSAVRLDLKNREFQEWEPGYGDTMLIDPRLPNPPGENSGGISTISGEISLVEFGTSSFTLETTGPFAGDYLVEFTGAPPGITPDPGNFATLPSGVSVQRALPNAVEIGVQSEALGVYYTSVAFSISGVFHAYIGGDVETLAAARGIPSVTSVQSAQLKLTDDFKVKSYNADGGDKFPQLQFEEVRLVNFNVLPLYPFVAMMDNSVVNNIVIEELSPAGNFTKTPVWLYSSDSGISPTPLPTLTTGVSQQSDQFLPSSFNETDRLSAARFDTACQQPLRSGVPINSFFVGANQTVRIDLSNIFNPDRKTLSRGLLNNKAVYLTASAVGSGNAGGDVEVAVTVKEQ